MSGTKIGLVAARYFNLLFAHTYQVISFFPDIRTCKRLWNARICCVISRSDPDGTALSQSFPCIFPPSPKPPKYVFALDLRQSRAGRGQLVIDYSEFGRRPNAKAT